MVQLKTNATKENLLRGVRKQRLKYITILPSLITILNGLCGFAAIVFAANGAFAKSGYMVLLAMIADMLDGRVARMSKSTSSFGGQLDSLCDIISFGIAPAFLMLKIMEHKLNMIEPDLLHRSIWLASAAYVSCAAIRLARFNVENEEEESAHMSFMGLPTPAAAGTIVSLVILRQETIPKYLTENTLIYNIFDNSIMYLLPFIVLGTAVLMVTRIRYPHVLNQYLKGKKPLTHFIRVLVFLGLVIWNWRIASVLIFCSFAASGFVKWFYNTIIRKRKQPDTSIDELTTIPD